MAKGTSRDKATLNSEEIKAVTIAIIKLHLSEGIIKSVRQTIENSVKQEFHMTFVEDFMVDLKIFLGLAMPNQSCPDELVSGDILGQEVPNLHESYI